MLMYHQMDGEMLSRGKRFTLLSVQSLYVVEVKLARRNTCEAHGALS
jgi:hypothetical protein